MKTLLDIVRLPREEQIERGLLYTPREIAQQPATWRKTLGIFEHPETAASVRKFLEETGVRGPLEQRPVVLLIGAGTSDYIGHALALLLKQRWGCEVSACASTDLLPNLDEYVVPGRKYLWISFSRSGDSPEGVAVLEQATERYPEISHLVITCNSKGRMSAICRNHKHSRVVVLKEEVNDRSLAMTSSFTNMVVMGHCLAHAWDLDSYIPVMQNLQAAGEALLVSGYALASKLASRRYSRACFVGTGSLAAVAKESALKVLEMSAGLTKTMSETTLGLRHGPMAALDRETLFVCFVSQQKRRQGYAADLLREIGKKQITAARIAVGPEEATAEFSSLCETYLPITAPVDDMYRPVCDILFGQLLGLCNSIEHNLKPDNPSPNGVISRVVQDFAIY